MDRQLDLELPVAAWAAEELGTSSPVQSAAAQRNGWIRCAYASKMIRTMMTAMMTAAMAIVRVFTGSS